MTRKIYVKECRDTVFNKSSFILMVPACFNGRVNKLNRVTPEKIDLTTQRPENMETWIPRQEDLETYIPRDLETYRTADQ